MRLLTTILFFLSFVAVSAQNKTGVWYGAIVFEPDGVREVDSEPRIRVDAQAGRIVNVPPVYAGSMSLSKSATPTEKYNYYAKAVRCLVNETEHTPSLFDLHGNFVFTDTSVVFNGIWESPFGKSRLGKFSFQPSIQSINVNPELLIQWNDIVKVVPEVIQLENWVPSTSNFDTILTKSFYIDLSIAETGVLDNDTLSIIIDGQVIEENLVLTDKKHDFRVNITSKDYHQLTIRTKSEGSIKGTGYLLSIATKENVYKYNLIQYKYNQSDWFFQKVGGRARSN